MYSIFTIKPEMSQQEKREIFFTWKDNINPQLWGYAEKGIYSSKWFWIKTLFKTFLPTLLYVLSAYFLNTGATLVLSCIFLPIQFLAVVFLFFAVIGAATMLRGLEVKKELGL